jgi:hypothetical protein
MGLISKLKSWLAPGASAALELYLRCDRCQAVCKVRVDPLRDLENTYQEDGPQYILTKEAMDAKCFRIMSIHMEFDQDRHVIVQEVTGGVFITAEEYRAGKDNMANCK